MMHEHLKRIRAGRLLRKFLGERYEFFILWLFIGGVASVPIAIVIFALAINGGHTTVATFTHTFASPRRHFVPGPRGRGTLNLISVCMSTIFTCVYVSVHGDVPDTSKADDFAEMLKRHHIPDFICNFFRRVYTFIENPTCKRILFMLFNVIAPELVVLVSMLEFFSAYDGLRFMRKCKQKNWSMTLAFFADMGGFELDDEDHTHFKDGRAFLEWFERYWRACDRDLEVDTRRIKEEIQDRSKANVVLKMMTLIQAGWLFIVTLVRFADKKAVSELEITTCAYIFCTAFTYLFWLSKPYNVGTRVVLRESLFSSPLLIQELKEKEKRTESAAASTSQEPVDDMMKSEVQLVDKEAKGERPISSTTRPRPPTRNSTHLRLSSYAIPTLPHDYNDEKPSTPLPIAIYPRARFTPFNRAYLHPEISWILACVWAGVVGGLVGAIHAAPLWDTTFINSTGQWLWRASCIVQIILPVLIGLVALIEWIYTGGPLFFAAMFMALVYGIARLILFALIILSFWNLPDGVYNDVDWSWSEFPHWH